MNRIFVPDNDVGAGFRGRLFARDFGRDKKRESDDALWVNEKKHEEAIRRATPSMPTNLGEGHDTLISKMGAAKVEDTEMDEVLSQTGSLSEFSAFGAASEASNYDQYVQSLDETAAGVEPKAKRMKIEPIASSTAASSGSPWNSKSLQQLDDVKRFRCDNIRISCSEGIWSVYRKSDGGPPQKVPQWLAGLRAVTNEELGNWRQTGSNLKILIPMAPYEALGGAQGTLSRQLKLHTGSQIVVRLFHNFAFFRWIVFFWSATRAGVRHGCVDFGLVARFCVYRWLTTSPFNIILRSCP